MGIDRIVEFLLSGLSKILYCGAILIVAIIITNILKGLLKKTITSKASRLDKRKTETILSVSNSVIKIIVYFIASCSILGQFGIDMASILTVAGIGSIAIAFGAQNIVKDVITGCFILLEDQYGVGDIITIDGVTGVVEEISIRTTSLRDPNGTLYIVPNGNVSRVANMCKQYINAIVDVGIDYGEDMDKVISILNNEMDRAVDRIEGLRKRPDVLGIIALDDSSVNVRIVAECDVKMNLAVERNIRLMVKKRLDSENISIPFPQRSIHIVNDGK